MKWVTCTYQGCDEVLPLNSVGTKEHLGFLIADSWMCDYCNILFDKGYEQFCKRSTNEMYRASGDCICDCGKLYYNHPDYLVELDSEGRPFLKFLCNGDIVKL